MAATVAKIEAVEASTKRLVYEVVISEDQGQFKFGSAALPEPVQQRIDQMIADLKANPRGNFVEIEGHTDSSGDKMVNQRIGEARAEAVKRYLYEAHQVPLHKMNVISWGEDKPVSPDRTERATAAHRIVGWSFASSRKTRYSKAGQEGRGQKCPLLSLFFPHPTHCDLTRSLRFPFPLYSECQCVSLLSKTTRPPAAG